MKSKVSNPVIIINLNVFYLTFFNEVNNFIKQKQ